VSNPGHHNQDSIRNTLRAIGPFVLGAGVIMVAIGFISFFAAFGSFGPPRYFWCAFVGMPLIAIGASLSRLGYMGAVGRYVAGEVAPVAKDTINYMAEGSTETIRHVSEAISEGLSKGRAPALLVRCHKCNTENQAQAKFCNSCGAALLKSKPCNQCGELNDPDARFCDNCGHSI